MPTRRSGGRNMNAAEISRALSANIETLLLDLLPAGHREGHEWRCGSVAGEAGNSLGVHLVGHKRGIWSDFSTDEKGDALDLVRAVHGFNMGEAIGWSRRWLGLDDDVHPARRSRPAPAPVLKPAPSHDFW